MSATDPLSDVAAVCVEVEVKNEPADDAKSGVALEENALMLVPDLHEEVDLDVKVESSTDLKVETSKLGSSLKRKRVTKRKTKLVRSYPCSYCPYQAKWPSHIKRHLLTHENEKDFECQYCDFKTRCSKSLRYHEKYHKFEKILQCPQCDYTTNIKHNYETHLRKHSDTKEFKCDLCDFETKYYNSLVQHMIKHHPRENEAPVAVIKIEKNLNVPQYDHFETIETNKKDYGCGFCEFEAKDKKSLALHLRLHKRRCWKIL